MNNVIRMGWSALMFVLIGLSMAQPSQMVGVDEQINSDFSTIPHYAKFQSEYHVNFNQFLPYLKKTFALDENIGFNQIEVIDDGLGYQHYRYEQTIGGVHVERSMLIAHVKDGVVESFSAELSDTLIEYEDDEHDHDHFSSREAIALAISSVHAQRYLWEVDEDSHKLEHNAREYENSPLYPKADKVFIATGIGLRGLRVAYKVIVVSVEPFAGKTLYLDPVTGEVIMEEEGVYNADVSATGNTKYSGQQTFTTSLNNSGQYVLKETGRGNGIETRDLRKQTTQEGLRGNFTSYEITNGSTSWWNISSSMQEGLDAHWGAEMTYDYFMEVHGRNSIDGNGQKLNSYINLSYDGANAFWLPGNDIMVYASGLVFPDVTAHEIGHGLTSKTANLVYSYESGALNESFSDIFGNSVERWARPNQWGWELGEDRGSPFRNMANPNAKGDPDTYGGSYWATGSEDNGGVHTNSGVQNHWYYILVEGKSGTNDNGDYYSVSGIGLEKAAKIAFRNLTVYLTPNSDYDDARTFAIKAAEDIYGVCSPEAIATQNAWYAVGVGAKHQSQSADVEFAASSETGCQIPSEISFASTGLGGTTYAWDFGDGATSDVANPTHTYTAEGDYTVSLYVSGACGNDELEKVDFISIDLDNPCVELMEVGSKTVTACKGILFDNGGATAPYTNERDYYVTIAPPLATQIDVKFTSFDIEPGDGSGGVTCNYDWVKLHDGMDENASEMASYCNSAPPTLNAVTSSTGGAMTIHLHADQLLNLEGFRLEWECLAPAVVDFEADDQEIKNCEEVTYTATNTTGSSYDWDFGDGADPASASGVGPHTVIYGTTGDKTISLEMDGDTETKVDYVTVSLDESISPAISISETGGSTCEGDEVGFSVTAENDSEASYEWFVNDESVSSQSSYNETLEDGDEVYVVLTADDDCVLPNAATSNTVSISLDATVSPEIEVSTPGTEFPVCEGSTISYEASIAHAGENGVVTWFLNGISMGETESLSLDNVPDGAFVHAVLASSLACVDDDEVTSNIVFAEVEVCSGITLSADNMTFRAYPNPTEGIIQIDGEYITKVVVSDMKGHVHVAPIKHTTTGVQIDLNQLDDGVYVIDAMINGEHIIQRATKRH